MPDRPYKRRINLVKRALQLSVVLYIFLTTLAVLSVHSWLLVWSYSQKVIDLGTIDRNLFVQIVVVTLLSTLLIAMALSFIVGILFSHRFAGPLWKIEQALKQVAKGDISLRLSLRRGDLLHDFCDVFNDALAGLRSIVAEEQKAIAAAEAAVERLKERIPARSPGAEDVDLLALKVATLRAKLLVDSVPPPAAVPAHAAPTS